MLCEYMDGKVSMVFNHNYFPKILFKVRRPTSVTYIVKVVHTHPFNGPLSRTTRVSQYPTGKQIWILLKQETVSGSGIRWAICKSASRSRQTTTPAPHHSVFLQAGRTSGCPTNSVKALKANIVKVVVSKKWYKTDMWFLHTTNRKYRMAYLLVPLPMTLDDLKGHSCNAGLIKCNSTNICVIFRMVPTDMERCAVSQR